MRIDKLQAVVDDDALGCQLTVHLGVLGSIQRNEIIRHDATATINHTMLAQSIILQAVGKMDAVLVGELAMLVAIVEIHRIIQSVSLLIRLLDTSAARRIIMCDGEANLAAIIEGERTLNQSLAEGSATYHHSTILILNGSGNNLCGRSCKLIGKHYHLTLAPSSVSLRLILLTGSCTTTGINDEISLLQELVGYLSRCLKVAAAIILKVEDQVFHSHFLERIHRRSHLLVAGQAEASQSDVSDSRTNHIRRIHRGYRNLIALHLESKLVLDATAHNGKIHRGSLRTAKAFHDFLLAHLHARNSRIIHRNDAVASYDSHLLGRTIHYGLDDEQGIIYHIKLHANAIETAIQRFIHRLGFLGCGIRGMRVELLEHTTDGVLHELVLIHTIHIEIGNGDFRPTQLLYRAVLAHLDTQLGTGRSYCQERHERK